MKESSDYALKRSQAIRSCEARLQKILFAAAKKITLLSSKYSSGERLVNEVAFLAEARRTTARLADSIEKSIEDYSLASCKILNISNVKVEAFLSSDIYGKSSHERIVGYLRNFADDIVRMSKAGILMGYTTDKILSAVRTGYREPYISSIVTKAQYKDVNIASPSYGKGVYRSAYKNIIRFADGVIALAWGVAEQQYGQEDGAIGFTSHRGSSFPCPYCDDETTYIHHFGDPYPPYHPRCVCWVKFIYPNK